MMKRKERRHSLIVPLLIILCLMVVMELYTSRLIYRVAVSNFHEVGLDRLSGVAAKIDNYLESTRSVLWVTADTVDYMRHENRSIDEILQYITEETDNQMRKFDENYTGIYGYIDGQYLDGAGWVPPEGYDPLQRDWYNQAIAGGGEIVIVPPYIDMQTHEAVITICRKLSNDGDVLAFDVIMNDIQATIEDLQVKDKGYSFIVDDTGTIIAHRDTALNGTDITETEAGRAFLQQVMTASNGSFETELDGEKTTVFVNPIMDQWYVVIAVSNTELYAEVREQMTVNILICLVIFVLIGLFYYLGYRNEQNYARRMEEMKMEEQQQAYETKMLKLAKEAADEANKAKSDFLAEMSHEIRTPINAVLGMNEMIMRESSDGMALAEGQPTEASFRDISRYAANIDSAGNNLLSIINDILDLSKIESGRLEIVEGNYQLSSVLNDVSNMIFFRAKEKGLDFSVDVDEAIPDGLYGDEVRVRQVITNLLSNAVKYTDRGSIRMTMRGEIGTGNVITLTIRVADTGIGIREDDIDKLFTKFQRVDLERNSTVEGAGLGLAITRSLLDKMGGSIRAESEYGKGSTFTVTLPQKIVSREPVGDFQVRFDKNARGAKAYEARFHAPDARILVVDDTRMNLAVAVGLLKKTEMKIDTAQSGAEAIDLAKHTPYDLILMDQRMPGMDGTEALRHIRAGGVNADTPVICLTADAVIGAKERYIAEGFTDYLTKPIDSQALEKLLARHIPAGKVVEVARQEPMPEAPEGDGGCDPFYAPLAQAGMDPADGLQYCQGDDELYRSLLWEYADGAAEKARDLRQCFDEKDWKNYAIHAHSLKSTSRTLGAAALSDIALRAEAAADAGDAEAVAQLHGDMLSRYEAVVEAISRLDLQPSGFGADDDGIMEFMPE